MDEIIVIGALLLLTVIFVIMGIAEKHRYEKVIKERISAEYGKKPDAETAERLHLAEAYYREYPGKWDIDDITWSDLDMDRLFTVMNRTYSSAGEEMLYDMLRKPVFDEDELKRREESIVYFSEHKQEREQLQYLFASVGKNRYYSLYDYLRFAGELEGGDKLKYHIAAPILLLLAVAMIFVSTGTGILLTIAVVVANMVSYYRVKGRILPYYTNLRYILHVIAAGEQIGNLQLPVCEIEQDRIRQSVSGMGKFRSGAGIILAGEQNSGNPMEILRDYLYMLLHIDIIFFYRTYKEMNDKHDEIVEIERNLGMIEAMIAVASYRKSTGMWCLPVFDNTQSAVEIAHPLVEDAVTNSYSFSKPVLLTGSNASGKSTFLKTVALAMIMSQTIHTVCAGEYHTSFYRIYSSMALRDDLAGKESYFMAEIRAMSRILEAGEEDGPVVACFVDEVLRGTNTVERIAASTRILEFMAEKGYFCLAATHDIELTGLLEEEYDNYHFEEEIKDNDVLFNYRLQKGKATSRNAIRLLRLMGYDEEIVKKAETMAGKFVKENRWSKEN
mgnify:CR=1 FL=1